MLVSSWAGRLPWERILIVVIAVAIPVSHSFAQWKTYTMKRDVRDVVLAKDSTLWVATGGGMFSFHFSDSTYREFTTSEGLRTINLSAVAVDREGYIWSGAEDGFLHRLNPVTHEWQYVTDIFGLTNPQKRINALHVLGDTLVILSDVGVSFFSISKMEFGDTYRQFGSGVTQKTGNVIDIALFSGKIWLATRSGIVATETSNPNPAVPESWEVFSPNVNVSGLVVLDSALYASTSAGLFHFNGISWDTVSGSKGFNLIGVSDELPGISGCGSVIELIRDFDSLHVPRRSELWSFDGNQLLRLSSTFPSLLSSISSAGILGSQTAGVFIYHPCVNDEHPVTGLAANLFPPGPPSNKFISIAVDTRGSLWYATGPVNAEGFASFDGSTWKHYSVSSDPRLKTNNFYKVSVGRNNAKWISSFGNGIALIDDEGTFQKMYDASNGIPPSIDPSFVVTGGVAVDRNGRTWITDRTPPADTSIVILNPDFSFSYVVGCGPGCTTRRTQIATLSDVVIDEYGTKWFTNFSRFEPFLPDRLAALLYYNEEFALPGSIGGWGKLTTSDGLASAQIWSLAVDLDGTLWIGTDQGISLLYNPTDPQAGIAAYHPPINQVVQSIVVDALNNKWIATKQGVFVLAPGGDSILDHYTVESTNGKLLDDDVISIAIDNRSGVFYFGTEKGLTSLKTPAVEPKRSFDELSFAPNPFHIPSSREVIVDGLVKGSTLKILAVDGNVVREVHTPGGRVGSWDGRNEQGALVSTGVYIVVAYSDDGTKIAKGKLAVIRQ